jgi:signal transduction histidine kinase
LTEQLKTQEMLAALGLNTTKIAHEIANALNSMSSCVQMLEREMTKGKVIRGRILETIHNLSAEIGRLQTLLQELREFGRPMKLNSVPVRLAPAVAEVLHQSLTTTIAPPFQIQEDIPEDLPPVMADPEKLRQVLLNLTKNAIELKQCPRGAGSFCGVIN